MVGYIDLTAGSSANTGAYSWGETYSIDAWGNLQISPMAGKAHGGTFALSGNAQNRPTGMAYDSAGNLTNYTSPGQYVYDQENRLSSTAGMSYTYDGNGERVLKSNTSTGAAVKRYWSMGGNTLAESDASGNLTAEYIYFGGKRVARIDLPANTVHYYLADHLGSTSIVANAAGVVEEESDFYPFGTEVIVMGPGANELKFTGKRRDSESQLDYFGARYYSNAFGRFLTPDWSAKPVAIPYAELLDPQTFNQYGYVRNIPTGKVDPDGHSVQVDDDKALQRIRSTLPKDVQSKVTLDKKGMINKSLLKLKSNDPNVKALRQLVKNSNTLEVKTATSVDLSKSGNVAFKYESAESISADLKSKGIDLDSKNITPTNFLGYTFDAKDTPSGNATSVLSDGTGQAASAPGVEQAVTTAHEVYGHGLAQISGRPWEHDHGGPVDTNIKTIEQHTREVYEHDHL
ncbi:MAG: RHS repeat domain-containing protein [Terriglobales bacterium]